jgi:hypothetical protein
MVFDCEGKYTFSAMRIQGTNTSERRRELDDLRVLGNPKSAMAGPRATAPVNDIGWLALLY